jgi:hypothetical protein
VVGRRTARAGTLRLAAQQPELDRTDSREGIEAWMARILRGQSRKGGPFGCSLGTIAAELKNDAGTVASVAENVRGAGLTRYCT